MEIRVSNLSKGYLKQPDVLKDVSFEIKDVKCVGIIGESGCGKSTMLRQLAGIEDPDNGEIVINGLSPIINKKVFQEKIGVVFQKHNLFPHLTVRKNITLILEKIKKIDKNSANKRVEEVLKELFIQGIAEKKPNEISGGQAQRASIARALSTNPELLFLDEPTGALDPILTDEVLKSVKALKKSGRDFIFVTHEMDFLREFADYVIFMKEGEICEQGSAEILQNPSTQELSEFLKIEKNDYKGMGKK